MQEVQFKLNDIGRGAFYIGQEKDHTGEMVVSVKDDTLTVYHTEVKPEAEGKGLAKTMLTSMVDYARANHLKVNPLCQYVHAQFKRHPDQYADIWTPGT